MMKNALHSYPIRTTLAKEAITHYTVLATYDGHAFLMLNPKTGRKHQLRIQLSASGHPVMGDKNTVQVLTSFMVFLFMHIPSPSSTPSKMKR